MDQGELETHKSVCYERGIFVNALSLGLTGKLNLLEKNLANGKLLLVEYKRDKLKQYAADTIQLCV